MTDTAPLTIHALTVIAHHLMPLAAEWGDLDLQGEGEIPAAALTELREVWGLLLGCGEYVAADWLAAQVNSGVGYWCGTRLERGEDVGAAHIAWPRARRWCPRRLAGWVICAVAAAGCDTPSLLGVSLPAAHLHKEAGVGSVTRVLGL